MGSKSKKKVTVGYRYYWDLLMGLGRGPVNEIVEIRIDDKQAWAGTTNQASISSEVFVRKTKLFGGEDVGGDGGIDGVIEFNMGEPDQLPTDNIKKLVKGTVPAFRGVVTVFFSGYISAFNAYPKKWSLRVRRSTKGWYEGVAWYPEKAKILLRNDNAQVTVNVNNNLEGMFGFIRPNPPSYNVDVPAVTENLKQIHAMNPVHIIVEAATNADWGLGLAFEMLDLDSYKKAADTLFAEGFGLCLRYNRQSDINTFIQQVLDHIGAAQYLDTEVGKLKIKLIRNDYVPEELPLFNYDNGILRVQDDDSTSSDNAINYLTVEFRDPVTNKNGDVTYQNLASIQSHGVISETRQYLALPTFDLAARVAQRDLAMTASGLTRLVLRCDRRVGMLTPASCFRVNLPDRNINNMIMRVGSMKEDQRTGEWIVIAVQDLFGLPSTNYASAQPPVEWQPADRTPRPVKITQLIETPYFVLSGLLSEAEMQYLADDAGYMGVLALAPTTLSLNYDLQVRTSSTEFKSAATGDWSRKSTLIDEIGLHDTQFIIGGEVSNELPAAVMIDDEIINIIEINYQTGVVIAQRGCADTIPAVHAADSIIWYLSTAEADSQQYISGESVYTKLLTNTSLDQLAIDDAFEHSVTMAQRQFRPYPPGNVKINGVAWSFDATDASNGFKLTWSHRDRALQSDTLFGHRVGDIGPEPGTAYVITLYKNNRKVRGMVTEGNSWSYPDALAEYEEFDRLTLHSQRDGLLSQQYYELNVSWPDNTLKLIFDEMSYSPPASDNIILKFKG